ncbi:Histidine-specific methyltransferase EgtD protein, partial [Marine Group I thaumarchaeote SCGC AAA799-P11]
TSSKSIHPKFFYDKKGSDLFEQICSVSEYYPTRTEISILEKLQTELSSFLNGDYRLVELGSGSSIKTRLILDFLTSSQKTTEYFPIDIS